MSAAVIALPTAAPAKVRQRPSQTRKADREALLRFPAIRKTATQRAKETRRELAMEADLPSLFLIVRAMGAAMDHSQRRRASLILALGADAVGGPEACAWFETFVSDPAKLIEGGE